MGKCERGFFRGIAVGLTAGIILGGTGAAWAGFGKKGWERFGQWFQEGYVAGFNDCVRLSKALEPDGYVATNYILPPKAKPHMWRIKINEIYAKEENADRPMSQVMVMAGQDLAKQTGYVELKGGDPRVEGLRQAMEQRQKAIRDASKAAKGEGQSTSPDPKAAAPTPGEDAAPASPIEAQPTPVPAPAADSKALPSQAVPTVKPSEAAGAK
jgi:hypothetical protein